MELRIRPEGIYTRDKTLFEFLAEMSENLFVAFAQDVKMGVTVAHASH